MEAFRPTRGGGASASFAAGEASLLRSLVDQVASMLRGTNGGGTEPHSSAGGGTNPGAGGADDVDGGAGGVAGLRDLDAMFGYSQPTGPPEDPALARLLPDAYRDDPKAAGEFRRYTEQSLRSAKRAAARTVLETLPASGGPVTLSADQAQAWLRALNDVRLTLGVRLGVTEEFEEQWERLDPDDPRCTAFEVYAWLGGVQESLVEALT